MTTIFEARQILPGVSARIHVPRPGDPTLNVPWLYIGSGSVQFHPDLTHETAAQLRLLANDIDAAFAVLARRAALAAQPQDVDQFTTLNPEEDAAMDNLAAGLPAFAPRVEE